MTHTPSEQLPFGIDVSKHQGFINWDVVAAHKPKVHFAGIRAGISWGYIDKLFARNWEEAKRVGIARAAYHVLYPDQPWQRQMDHFLKIVGDDLGELPLVLDLELDRGVKPEQMQEVVFSCVKYLIAKQSRNPIIYSRAQWVNDYMTGPRVPPSWYPYVFWWLAHYTMSGAEHQGPPALPRGVKDGVIIHQTSDKQPNIGGQASATDYNRWQGDEADFYDFIGIAQPTPPVSSCEDKLARIQAILEE